MWQRMSSERCFSSSNILTLLSDSSSRLVACFSMLLMRWSIILSPTFPICLFRRSRVFEKEGRIFGFSSQQLSSRSRITGGQEELGTLGLMRNITRYIVQYDVAASVKKYRKNFCYCNGTNYWCNFFISYLEFTVLNEILYCHTPDTSSANVTPSVGELTIDWL